MRNFTCGDAEHFFFFALSSNDIIVLRAFFRLFNPVKRILTEISTGWYAGSRGRVAATTATTATYRSTAHGDVDGLRGRLSVGIRHGHLDLVDVRPQDRVDRQISRRWVDNEIARQKNDGENIKQCHG